MKGEHQRAENDRGYNAGYRMQSSVGFTFVEAHRALHVWFGLVSGGFMRKKVISAGKMLAD
ncbi:hypothetical protein AYI73_16000 [Shewanella algae]|nr:hypothetical protein AYI73_16000 [Shewanella algae]